MMDSTQWERLEAYLDGELDPEAHAEITRLLETSEEAREALEQLRAQHDELDRLLGPDSGDFASRIAEQVGREIDSPARPIPSSSDLSSSTKFSHRIPWLSLVASAAAGFLLAWLVFGLDDETGRNDPSVEPPVVDDPQDEQSAPTLGRLVLATGNVHYRKFEGAPYVALPLGAMVPVGAWIRTGEEAKCSLELEDGTRVRVNRGTELELETPRRLELTRGQVYTEVRPAPTRFEVYAGKTVIEALGTTLDIARDPAVAEGPFQGQDVTTLRVLEGQARIGETTVEEGEARVSVGGELSERSVKEDLVLATRWVHELMRQSEDDPGLAARIDAMLAILGRTKMDTLYGWEIRSLGESAIMPLVRYLQSEKSHRRRYLAAEILGDLAGPSHVEELVGLLEDDNASVRWLMAKALSRITGEIGYSRDYWLGDDVTQGVEEWKEWLRSREG